MSRILVVGGVNMDLHLFGVRPSINGSPLLVDHYTTEPGGKGANVARAVSRLGVEVGLVARVGDDEFGRGCLDAIVADGVDVSAVVTMPGVPTGFVAIELADGHHRTLVFAPGANDELMWDDIEPAMSTLAAGDIVITQAEVPSRTLATLAAAAAANGIRLFLDPSPPHRVEPSWLHTAEVITPDLAEAAALTGRTDSSQLWPTFAARDLHGLGRTTVIVKTGAAGAVIATGDGVVTVPTSAVRARDETGAGDVFLAALAVRRSEQADWIEAVRFANVASALSVADTGLLLPDRPSVERALADLPSRLGSDPN